MSDQHSVPPPVELDEDASPQIEESSLLTRAVIWASELPWWAIILVIAIVGVIYSMSTSMVYQNAIRFLTDDPHVSTDDLFDVVQVVGEPKMVTGVFVGESSDSVDTVINELIENAIDSDLVRRSGFIEREGPATLTLRLDDGSQERIRKEYIVSEEREETENGTRITVDYVDRVTITGTLVERDDDTMRIRTTDEEIETVDKALVEAIIEDEGDRVTIQRRGATFNAQMTTLSNTAMDVQFDDGETEEFRLNEIEWFHIPTLTIAVNEAASGRVVGAGDTVRVGYIEGTDIIQALAELDALDNVPVPLRYADGSATVSLTPFADLDSVMFATGAGVVDGLLYLDDSDTRFAVADWVESHPDSGVIIPDEPRECIRDCPVTFKLLDDEITGVIIAETDDTYTLQTVTPEYVIVDRDQVLDNKMEPGTCAFNNLRGCDEGIFLTLRVTFMSYAMALVIGLIIGLMRIQTNPTTIAARWVNTILKTISTLYVEIVRGIPLLVILLYAGFVVSPQLREGLLLFDLNWFGDSLPDIVIRLPKLNVSDTQEAVIGLAFGYGAFIAEIFRAGIQSIGRGQMEAARSLGMSYPQAMRYVILPQAIRVVLPPLGNDFIALLKDSALISVLALPDLLQLGRLHVSRTFRAIEGYNTVAIMYLMMTLFLSLMVRVIERRSRLPE